MNFVSKTIKRVVAVHFHEHCEAHNLLPVCESAYKACHSTETAAAIVHNNIVRNNEQINRVRILVLLDFSSAFDTVDHKLLLDTLERGNTRYASEMVYLISCRTNAQTFQVGTEKSKTFAVNCSVPQCSILRLLKFIAYTEDLPSVVHQKNTMWIRIFTQWTANSTIICCCPTSAPSYQRWKTA